jgi:hypothetical protein
MDDASMTTDKGRAERRLINMLNAAAAETSNTKFLLFNLNFHSLTSPLPNHVIDWDLKTLKPSPHGASLHPKLSQFHKRLSYFKLRNDLHFS